MKALLFLGICFLLQGGLVGKERFTGPISLEEKRIHTIKKESPEKLPASWKVFFKEFNGNYAVFYDWNGHEIYFQYRRNKFDEDGILFAKDLLPGNAYEAVGEIWGGIVFPMDSRGRRTAVGIWKKGNLTREDWMDKETIPVLQLKSYKELHSKEVLY